MSTPAPTTPFVLAALDSLDAATRARLTDRRDAVSPQLTARVVEILAEVRRDGDAALRRLTAELDGVTPAAFEVSRARVDAALERVPAPLRDALEQAAEAIWRVHRAQRPRPVEVEPVPGLIVGRRPDPLDRVGVYAPGGRARYPSSVLMGAVPARVAGVREIVLVTPPGPDGAPHDITLAAAAIAGVDRVFALGGAQAIAALAYGTASVPRVDAIVGPGNAWVAEAKRQVAGVLRVDAPAGPSELLVIAEDADADLVVRELIAQAEHDPLAAVIALVVGEGPARVVAQRLEAAAGEAARREVVQAALAARGAVLGCDTLEQALAFANDWAPEHLLLLVPDAGAALARVRNVGAVFLGAGSSVTLGDYATGANHTLPTGGAARAWSGLGVESFVRWTSWQRVAAPAWDGLSRVAQTLAEAEGLPGHAAAARGPAARDSEDAGRPVPEAGRGADHPTTPRVDYLSLSPYVLEGAPSPDAAACDLDLSQNTSRFGVPPAALRTLAACEPDTVAHYPAHEHALLRRLAHRLEVDTANVCVGCGSDDLLDAMFRALVRPGGRIAYTMPTFSMVPAFAATNGLERIEVAARPDGSLDVAALLAADADLVYVASPDNPTGRAHPRESITRLSDAGRAIVIVDHAYVEFGGDDLTRAAARDPRIVVTRTLSKAFGLAGLRIGYAVAERHRIADIGKALGPFTVGGPALLAAIAALEHDTAWVEARIAEVRALRSRFAGALRDAGFAPLASHANFVLVPVRDAGAARDVLERAGVRVRSFRALPGIGDALRITIGPWHELERVLTALREVEPCA